MVRLLLIGAALAALVYALRTWRGLPPAERRRFGTKLVWGAVVGLLLLLVVTGRMHWLFAAFAALLPMLKIALRVAAPWLAGQVAARLRQRSGSATGKQGSAGDQRPPPRSNHGMDQAEALATLGLQPGASRDEIVQAHRRLMQKMHPDRGGTDHLAARINLAKEALLRRQA